ncbi:hypothetical protein WDU94_015509 [Cyamophila willieti]
MTVNLILAYDPSASAISERAFKAMKASLFAWSVGQALLYSPADFAIALSPSQEDFDAFIELLKPIKRRKLSKIYNVRCDEDKKKELSLWLEYYDLEHYNHVVKRELTTSKRRNRNQFDKLPLSSDLLTLDAFLAQVSYQCSLKLKKTFSSKTWPRMAYSLACRVLLYNSRRLREVSKITLEDYQRKHLVPIMEDYLLNEEEKERARELYRLECEDLKPQAIYPDTDPENFQANFLDHLFRSERPKLPATSRSPLLTTRFFPSPSGDPVPSMNTLRFLLFALTQYVDDVFVVVAATNRQIEKLLNLINSIHPNLTFTLETEVDCKINFLDLTVMRVGSSYRIVKPELLSSAVELFEGTALTWYMANRSSFTSWRQLEVKLMTAFSPPLFGLGLWREIMSRKQREDESVVKYVSSMKILFNRLSSPVDHSLELEIVITKSLPCYQEKLNFVDIHNIDDLESSMIRLETVNGLIVSRNRFP